jgi:hypothetical protein
MNKTCKRLAAAAAAMLVFAVCVQAQQPAMPYVRSLSIDPASGDVVLKWKSPDVSDNVLVHEISRKPYTSLNYFFNSPPDGTVAAPDTVFTETVADLVNQRQSYRVRSKNSTDYSPISDLFITMQFSGEYNQCSNTITVRWTEYRRRHVNENGQFDDADLDAKKYNDAITYEVWGHYGGVFDPAKAVRMSENTGRLADVTLSNLTVDTVYYLFVKALLPGNDTATSHRIEVRTTNRSFPSVFRIDSIVNENGMVDVYMDVDKTTEIDTFALYRADVRTPLEWYYSPTDIPRKFTDRTVSIGQVYRYSLVGYMCGKPAITSDTASNILLYANDTSANLIKLTWTPFFNGEHSPVYTLYRTFPTYMQISPAWNALRHLDESTKEYACYGAQKFCYVLFADTQFSHAKSAEACATISPVITVPEAIDPLSDITSDNNCNCSSDCSNYRRLFGPVMDLSDDAYAMQIEIYDRSGLRLFSSTKELNEALNKEKHFWNGAYNGRRVKPGVYVYLVKLAFLNASPVSRRGSVTVVR